MLAPTTVAASGAGMRLAIRIDPVGSLILATRPPVGSPRMLTGILLCACPLLARLVPLTLLTGLPLAGLLLLLTRAGAASTSAAAPSSLLTSALRSVARALLLLLCLTLALAGLPQTATRLLPLPARITA